MQISTRAGYETALFKESPVLPVRAMREEIARLRHSLETQGIRPGDMVAVYLSKTADLICAAWALLYTRAHIVFIEPSKEGADSCPELVRSALTCWITEERYASYAGAACVMCIDGGGAGGAGAGGADDAGDRVDTGDAAEADHEIAFYYSCGPEVREEIVTPAGLEAYFEKLDALISPAAHRRILLSSCTLFSRRVMELVWASSRGLTVVTAEVANPAAVRTYTLPADGVVMDFGLFFFGSYIETADRNKYALLFDTVRFADRRGFKAVWTPERHFNAFGGLYPNPSVMSAALAMVTERVQIRSGSLVAPLHHPVRIAEDWALVDNLSNGRAAVSFASGWQCDDFIFFPQNYSDRHNCMLSQIDVVRRLWAGEQIAFANGLGKETSVAIFPKPVHGPLPVWITVSGRIETFIDAGRIGANILTHLLWQDANELIEKISAYRKALKENGFDPAMGRVAIMVHTFLGSSDEAVKEKVRKPLTQYIRSSTQLIQAMVRSNATTAAHAKEVGGRYGDLDGEVSDRLLDEMAGIAFERFFEQAALLGTIEKGKKLIGRLRGYDVDEVACLIDFGLSREDILEGLTYLEQLKDEYARYPVEVTHCSQDTLQRGMDDAGVSRYLGSQRVLLVDDVSVEDIPVRWTKGAASAAGEKFTAVLNEEF